MRTGNEASACYWFRQLMPSILSCGIMSLLSVSRGDQLHVSYQLLYHTMTLLKSCTDKAFELVIDLTHATQSNEPDVRGEGKEGGRERWEGGWEKEEGNEGGKGKKDR